MPQIPVNMIVVLAPFTPHNRGASAIQALLIPAFTYHTSVSLALAVHGGVSVEVDVTYRVPSFCSLSHMP